MLQARGCPVYGGLEPDLGPHLAKLPKEKTIVFDLTSSGVQNQGDSQVLKASLALQHFREGLESVAAGLEGQTDKTQCVFVGDAAAKLPDVVSGMVAACAVKSIQTILKMRAMIAEGITEKEWTEKLISKTFEEVGKVESFDVISSLVEKLGPGGQLGKILADKMIDLCDEKLNLRKCINELKDKYDLSDESRDLKLQTIDSLERYFYLVCFCTYLRTEAELATSKKFSDWIKEHSFVADMVEHGIRFWRDMTFFTLTTRAAANPAG